MINKKYVQYFPGGYDKEDKAARSYDLAALKYWGPTATTNFPVISQSFRIQVILITLLRIRIRKLLKPIKIANYWCNYVFPCRYLVTPQN